MLNRKAKKKKKKKEKGKTHQGPEAREVEVGRGMQIGNRQMTEMAAVRRARALERSGANVSEVTGI